MLVGRVVPVVRSLISVPAGVARMPLGRFTAYTALGSAGYNSALIGLGYLLGNRWRSIGLYSDYLNAAVWAALALALALAVRRRLRRRRRERVPQQSG